MAYKKIFDPKEVESFIEDFDKELDKSGDQRDGSLYVYSEDIILAVNVSIATGRPLLVRGPAGSGKSSLAANIARSCGYRYYETVITAKTQARDLLWSFDAVLRLGDAQAKILDIAKGLYPYIDPGVIWWAFDRESALRRGLPDTKPVTFPEPKDPGVGPSESTAVVLVDEIDKADPDVPNNLLVSLGSLEFRVEEIDSLVKADQLPIILITTNEERRLPSAFLRRCVQLTLPDHKVEDLVRIANAHFGEQHQKIYLPLANKIIEIRTKHRSKSIRPPSTAEYLDAVRACIKLKINPGSKYWDQLIQSSMAKQAGHQR
jgi:MoxR-like ATPase